MHKALEGFGFRVEGLGFRVEGLGFRVMAFRVSVSTCFRQKVSAQFDEGAWITLARFNSLAAMGESQFPFTVSSPLHFNFLFLSILHYLGNITIQPPYSIPIYAPYP